MRQLGSLKLKECVVEYKTHFVLPFNQQLIISVLLLFSFISTLLIISVQTICTGRWQYEESNTDVIVSREVQTSAGLTDKRNCPLLSIILHEHEHAVHSQFILLVWLKAEYCIYVRLERGNKIIISFHRENIGTFSVRCKT